MSARTFFLFPMVFIHFSAKLSCYFPL